MELVWFASGALGMVAIIIAWGILGDWALERKIKQREEAYRRERQEKQKRFEAATAASEGDQGDLFAGREQDKGAGK